MWKQFSDYFHLSRSEERGWRILIVLLFLYALFPSVYDRLQPTPIPAALPEDWTVFLSADSLSEASGTDTSQQLATQAARAKAIRPRSESKASSRKSAVDINTADSAELRTVYGIGAVLSARIVKYRGLLGGFRSLDQLKEVYGIDSVRFTELAPRLTVVSSDIQRIDLNSADFRTLIRHPYMDKEQTVAILRYREQHGSINALSELLSTHRFEQADLEKLQAYITLGDGTQ